MNTKPLDILLVEDNPDDGRFIEASLEETSIYRFQVNHVRCLMDAVTMVNKQSFDAILLDLSLPDSQGFATLKGLQQHTRDVPILVLTEVIDEENALKAVQRGAQDYLVKDQLDEFSLPRIIRYAVERFGIQRELEERQRQLDTLIGNLQGMVYRCHNDLRWSMVYVSQGVKPLTGYDQEELKVGGEVSYADVIHPDDRKRVWEEVQNAVRANQSFRVQYRIITKDGDLKWVWEEGNAIGERDGETMLEGYISDITERVKSKKDLVESERRYRLLAETAQDIIVSHDLDGTITYVNQAGLSISGYEKEDLIGKSVTDLVVDDEKEELFSRQQKRLGGDEKQYLYDTVNVGEGGEEIPVEVSSSPIVNGDKVEGFLLVVRDIRDRLRAEQDLRESEEKFRSLVDQAAEMFFLHDLEGDIVEVNRAAIETTGYSRDELENLNIFDIDPEARERDIKFDYFQSLTPQDEPVTFESTHKRKDGSVYLAEVTISKVVLRNGEFILALARDITEQKEAREKLKKSELRYRNIFNATPVSIWEEDFSSVEEELNALDSEGVTDLRAYMNDNPGFIDQVIQEVVVKDVNTEALDMFEAQSKEELLGSLDKISTPQMRGFMRDLILAIDRGETYFEGETVNRTLQGKEINVLLTMRIPLKKEGLDEVLISMMDITERKQAEKKYHNLYNSIRDAILIANTNREIIDCNPAFTEIFGYTLDEIQGKKTSHVYEDYQQYQKLDRMLKEQGNDEKLFLTINCRKKSGAVFPGEVNVFNLKDESGETVAFVGLIRDITDRIEAQHRLEESEKRYRSLFESVPIGLYRTTVEGDLTDVNEALVKMLRYPDRESMLGINANALYAKPGDEQKWMSMMDQQGEVRGFEVKFERYDGTIIWVQDNTRKIFNDQGQLVAYQGSLEDITRRKRSQKELQQRSRQMEVLREIGINLTSELDLEELLHDLVHSAVDLVDGVSGSFNLIDADQNVLNMNVSLGYEVMPDSPSINKGQGLMGRVWEQEECIMVNDYAGWEGHIPRWVKVIGHRAMAGVPVMWRDEMLGVLEVQRKSGLSFTDRDIRFLELFASQAAVAVHNAQLFENAQERLDRLQAMREIDQTISGSLDLKTTLNVLLDRLLHNLEVDAGSILLYEPQLQTLDYVSGFGFRTNNIPDSNIRIGEGQAGKAALERKTIHIPDLTLETVHFERAKLIRREGFVSYFGVPLIAKGEIVGVLEVFHRKLLDPDKEWINFLETLAGQAAIAIDRLDLFNSLERSNMELIRAYNEVIEGWSRALELRDQETEGHSRRVEQLTLTMARKMGMKESEIADVRQGTLLHDIGKMAVPDRILQKPGKLTEEEWEVMRKHPTFAYEMLSPIDHLQSALDIPYCHHEKWDGSGYPRGLQGEEIPLAARIFAVVDVWDALRSDRPYRDAWSDEKALTYITEQSGKHFDPRVVDVFLEVVGEL